MFSAKRDINRTISFKRLTNLFNDIYNQTKKDNDFSYDKKLVPFSEYCLKILNPDFMIIIDILKAKIFFFENFNLKFDENKENPSKEITKSIVAHQADKIFKADKRVLEFISNNGELFVEFSYQLKFPANLIKEKTRTLFRCISFIYDNLTQSYLSVLSITDETDMIGIGGDASCCKLKWTRGVDLALDKKMMCLEKELKEILEPEIKCTVREKEILSLISIGKTSDMIAEELFISVATVNTHRQNLIRKFEVKNTASLINLVLS